jgi:hypothetical protein
MIGLAARKHLVAREFPQRVDVETRPVVGFHASFSLIPTRLFQQHITI